MPNIPNDYKSVTGIQRAAILIHVLGASCSKKLFGELRDNDVKRLLSEVSGVEKAPISVVKMILEDFFSSLSEEETLIFARSQGKTFITETLGENRAKKLFGSAGLESRGKTLEALEFVDPRALANFLTNEHPQTIALIVAHLDPTRKKETVKRLPDSVQAEVLARLAKLDQISPDLIAQVDEVLKAEFATIGATDSTVRGGVEPVASMINAMDKTSGNNILSRIEQKDPSMAEEIRKLMFVFEDLALLDDKGIREVLKKVPGDKLLVALKTASDKVKDRVFGNMSSKASQLLKEDLANLPQKKLSEVEAAQAEILSITKLLEDAGTISINRGNSEKLV